MRRSLLHLMTWRRKRMSIKIEYLSEPYLQFGHYFEHEDSKTGLAEYGPFGQNISGLHPSEIRLGFIGTRETISVAQEWVQECSAPIESENIKRVKLKASINEGDLFQNATAPDVVLTRLEKILNRD